MSVARRAGVAAGAPGSRVQPGAPPGYAARRLAVATPFRDPARRAGRVGPQAAGQ